jgi:hypothetical protein
MAAYESEAGIDLDRQRPAIYHVAAAVSHLKSGSGRAPPSRQGRANAWLRLIVDDAF